MTLTNLTIALCVSGKHRQYMGLFILLLTALILVRGLTTIFALSSAKLGHTSKDHSSSAVHRNSSPEIMVLTWIIINNYH